MSGQAVADAARALVGTPYVWGGNVPATGLDCSGHAQVALAQAGVEPWASRFPAKLDMTADNLWRRCEVISTPELGCLAFYGTAEKGAHHVVVVTGCKMGRVDEVTGASAGNARCTSIELARRLGAEVRVRRGPDAHLYRKDFLGFRRGALL